VSARERLLEHLSLCEDVGYGYTEEARRLLASLDQVCTDLCGVAQRRIPHLEVS
jgi:hypothetical protein